MPGIRAGSRQVVPTRPSWPTPVLLVVGGRLIHGPVNVRCTPLGWTGRVRRPIPEGKGVEAKIFTPLTEVPRNPCCPLRPCLSLSVCHSVGSLCTACFCLCLGHLAILPSCLCLHSFLLHPIWNAFASPGRPPLVWQLLGSQCSWHSYTGHHI